MKLKTLCIWIWRAVAVGFAAAPGAVLALGIEMPDHDAFATARGNAFAATANDPAAVFYNPAGISQLEGFNISVGGYGLAYTDRYKGAGPTAGLQFDSRTEWALLPDIFATAALPKYHLTFGLGFYSPFGLVEEWPKTAPFAPFGQRGEVDYFTVNPVVAYQPIQTLSVAIGPTINYSQADLRQSYPVGALFPGSPAFGTRFTGRDTDVGFNAGIFWHPLPKHSFGINYRSATEMNYQGHADLPPPPFGTGAGTAASADFKFPRSIDFGYSFRPTDKWNLEADAEWINWETLNNLNLRATSIPGSPVLETLPFNWRSSWVFKLGGTRYLGENLRVSAGYMFVQNSVPSQYFNALIPDSDRHVFSVGIGGKVHKLSWDAAYQLAWGPSRTVSNNPLVLPNGNYEFLSHAFTFNVGYRF